MQGSEAGWASRDTGILSTSSLSVGVCQLTNPLLRFCICIKFYAKFSRLSSPGNGKIHCISTQSIYHKIGRIPPFLLGGGMNAAITIYRQMESGKQLRFFLFPFVKSCAIIDVERMFCSDWERRTCFVFDRMPAAKASVQR